MNRHREIIYSLRKDLLNGDGVGEIVQTMVDEKVESLIGRFTDPKEMPEDWDIQGLKENIARLFSFRPRIGPEDLGEDRFHDLKLEELRQMVEEQVRAAHNHRQEAFGKEDLGSLERFFMLQIIDNQWVSHLQDMEHMKEGIGLRGYGQLDPLREYQREGYALFEELMDRIREESLMTLSRIQILRQRPGEGTSERRRRAMQYSHGGDGDRPETVKREGKKIGRNAPCPCGSGKKYKKCCGAK
jgi:preprotein translocase subunit SecA